MASKRTHKHGDDRENHATPSDAAQAPLSRRSAKSHEIEDQLDRELDFVSGSKHELIEGILAEIEESCGKAILDAPIPRKGLPRPSETVRDRLFDLPDAHGGEAGETEDGIIDSVLRALKDQGLSTRPAMVRSVLKEYRRRGLVEYVQTTSCVPWKPGTDGPAIVVRWTQKGLTGRRRNQVGRRPRGAPPNSDRKRDERWFQQWNNGDFRRILDLAREVGEPERTVRLALDRARKRRKLED